MKERAGVSWVRNPSDSAKEFLFSLVVHRFRALLLILLALQTSCTRPMEADFGSQQGLADDEFLWVLRLNRDLDEKVTQSLSGQDSLAQGMTRAIFNQALPQLIRDILSDSLLAYEDYEFFEEEKPIENLQERMYKLGLSRQNYASLLQTCDLLVITRSAQGKVSHRPVFLRLVWHDPQGRVPDRNFACIKMADIDARNYPVLYNAGNMQLSTAFRLLKFYYQPAHLRSNKVDYSPSTPGDAEYLKQMVLRGQWDRVSFIDENLNISGVSIVKVSPKDMQDWTGTYEFSIDSPFTGRTTLYLTREADYLVADWILRSEPEKIYPYYTNAYFSPRAEYYIFPDAEDSLPQELWFVTHGDTLIGNRLSQPAQ